MVILSFALAYLLQLAPRDVLDDSPQVTLENLGKWVTLKIQVKIRIAMTPKLHYELRKLYSYQDAVVAEIRVTNRTRLPIELDSLDASIKPHPTLTDTHNVEWIPSPFHGCALYGPRSERPKLVVSPGEPMIYFACLDTAAGPLVPFVGKPVEEHPAKMRYEFSGFRSAYQPNGDYADTQKVYLTGSGTTVVHWSKGNAPAWTRYVRVSHASVPWDIPGGLLESKMLSRNPG